MLYARIINNQIVKYPAILQEEYPNTSFAYPITTDQLPNDIVIVKQISRPTDSNSSIIEGTPVLIDNEWQQTWIQTPADSTLLATRQQEKAQLIRALRQNKLGSSDWTELPSVIAIHTSEWAQEWQIYRQALRDITNQQDFPNSVVWPTPPGE